MNTSKITERAIALVLRQYADLDQLVNIRPFQCLSEEPFRPQDESGGTRSYPMIDIRSNSPNINPSLHTEHVSCVVTVATNEDEDQDHLQISNIFGSVQTVAQAIFDQSKSHLGGEELTLLKQVFSDEFGSSLNFGGITIEGADAPFDDDGIAVISMTINVHYSRKR